MKRTIVCEFWLGELYDLKTPKTTFALFDCIKVATLEATLEFRLIESKAIHQFTTSCITGREVSRLKDYPQST